MAGKITIVGLGAGDLDQLSLGVYKRLKEAPFLFLRTKEHPVVRDLEREGIAFETFDPIYKESERFEDVYETIAGRLLRQAAQSDIVYAVPGHPMVAEKTVQLLLERAGEKGIEVKIEGGQSFLDPLFAALKIDPIEGFAFFDALDLDPDHLPLDRHLIICQVYDAFVASEVKLTLLEHLPPEYEIVIAKAVGSVDETITRLPLYELDRAVHVDNLTSVYVPPVKDEALLNHTFPRLRKVIQKLRSPEGCPWDREQTHRSLRKYLLEEAFEVIEAIDDEDDDHLIEELGDVLLQVMLHAQIGEDEGYFNIYDVIRSLTDKMIRRHPHVFGEAVAADAEDVKRRWSAIKEREKGARPDSLMDEVNRALPPLMKALEIQKKAAKVGFDWDQAEPVWEKIVEELEEWRKEADNGNREGMEEECGDVLFSVVNLARKLGIDPTLALDGTNRKFSRRFKAMEQMAKSDGRDLTAMRPEEMERLWARAKEIIAKKKDFDV